MSTSPLETPATADLIARDRANLLHPNLPASVTDRVIMASGDGCTLVDTNGKSYLDATGGLWLAQIGHGRADLAKAASTQMEQLEYFTSFWEFSNEPAIELAERLVDIAPDSINRVYFTSGGSEGNDAAIRMARLYHHRRGDTERTWILARRNAYHGIAYGGGAATGLPIMHQGMGPHMPNVAHLTPPWTYHTEFFDGQDPVDFCVAELRATIEEIGADKIAAFVGEPIMGVAGMINPPQDYWRRIQEVLREYGILLILDEVVTAFGRIGEWFAAQYYGVEPDLIVTAKGITSGYIPLGAVLMSEAIAATLEEDYGFPIGYTYNGHPTACAVALANLDIIEREGLRARAHEIGGYLGGQLRDRLGGFDVVGEVRQVGMMLGVELVTDSVTRAPVLPLTNPPIADLIRAESGVIVRSGRNAIVLSPPLILTTGEADRIAVALEDAICRLRPDGTFTS